MKARQLPAQIYPKGYRVEQHGVHGRDGSVHFYSLSGSLVDGGDEMRVF